MVGEDLNSRLLVPRSSFFQGAVEAEYSTISQCAPGREEPLNLKIQARADCLMVGKWGEEGRKVRTCCQLSPVHIGEGCWFKQIMRCEESTEAPELNADITECQSWDTIMAAPGKDRNDYTRTLSEQRLSTKGFVTW